MKFQQNVYVAHTKISYRSYQQQVVAECGMKSTISHQLWPLWPIDQNFQRIYFRKNFHQSPLRAVQNCRAIVSFIHTAQFEVATFITFTIISNRRLSNLHILHNIFFLLHLIAQGSLNGFFYFTLG